MPLTQRFYSFLLSGAPSAYHLAAVSFRAAATDSTHPIAHSLTPLLRMLCRISLNGSFPSFYRRA